MSDSVDATIILAVRDEIAKGSAPILARLDSIDRRLAEGSTDIAVLKLRVEDCEKQPATGRTTKSKMSLGDKLWLAIALAAAGSIGGAIGTGALNLLHKGGP